MAKENKSDAIVIYSKDYKDYDKLLTLYSPVFGKRKAVLRGCKRPNSKQRFAGLPLFYGEFVLVEAKGYDIIKSVESKNIFINITKDYDKYLDVCQMLKIVEKNGEYNNYRMQFLLLLTYLTFVDSGKIDYQVCTAKFLMEILRMQGLEPNTDKCSSCGKQFDERVFFDQAMNCFVCENCCKNSCIEIKKSVIEVMDTIKNNKFLELVGKDFDEKSLISVKNILFDIVKVQL